MKKIVYSEIKGESKGYYALLAGLGFIVALALSAAWFMEHNGHYVTGMDNQVVWGLPHVFAIFLIVAASGALNIASIGSVFGKVAYKPLGRLSGLLAIALLVGGLAVLVLDLGRPDRLIVAMTRFNFTSIFAVNIFFYIGFMAIVAVYLWFQMERRMVKYASTAGLFAFLWRLSLTTATGSIFGFLVAREAYDSAVMAPLFIVMSFSFGLAIFNLVVIAATKGTERELGDVLIKRLGRLLGIFASAVLYFTAIQHLTNLYAAEHTGVERYILLDGGIITLIFWLGQVVLGGIIPIFMTLYPGKSINRTSLIWASLLIIAGGLAQVYVIVIAGQSWPLTLFPGMEVSSVIGDGVIANYAPSLPEFGLGLGGIAITGLVVALGIKVLRFLPQSLGDAVIDPHYGLKANK